MEDPVFREDDQLYTGELHALVAPDAAFELAASIATEALSLAPGLVHCQKRANRDARLLSFFLLTTEPQTPGIADEFPLLFEHITLRLNLLSLGVRECEFRRIDFDRPGSSVRLPLCGEFRGPFSDSAGALTPAAARFLEGVAAPAEAVEIIQKGRRPRLYHPLRGALEVAGCGRALEFALAGAEAEADGAWDWR